MRKLLLVPLVSGVLLSGHSFAEVNIGGYLETDLTSTSRKENSGADGAKDVETSVMDMGYWGSLVFEGSKESNGYTLSTKIEPAVSGGTVGLENAFISLAKGGLMVQVGRFESMQTYVEGMDGVLNTEDNADVMYDDFYKGETVRGFDSNKVLVGYSTGMISAELALSTLYKSDAFSMTTGDTTTSVGANMTGIRPGFSFETGGVKAALTIESVTWSPDNSDSKFEKTLMGNTIHLGYSNAMVAAGLSMASGTWEGKDGAGEATNKITNTSTSVHVDALGLLAGGDIGVAFHTLAGTETPKAGDEMKATQTAMTVQASIPMPADSALTIGLGTNSWEQDTGATAKPTVAGSKVLVRFSHSI